MNRRWISLIITIILFIIFLIVSVYFFLIPTSRVLDNGTATIQDADRVLKAICGPISTGKVPLGLTVPQASIDYCKSVLND